jgi:hypothetical protein
MALTQAQKTLIASARAAGSGELGATLSNEACVYLTALIIRDLNLQAQFPELTMNVPELFDQNDPRNLEISGYDLYTLLERLFSLIPDADTYFACLATLHKSRMKYARILAHQTIPTMDQVGPRALLQYGQMNPAALAGFILWRKWIFDVDNRAGQETGYLFEPIVASAIGGVPVSARKSPIRRRNNIAKGRQVDCIRQNCAYEIKIRVTIAASGQGRWSEELDFPRDCRESGYTPILIVMDPTPNVKLEELIKAFVREGGNAYIGDAAWKHLEEAAGAVMTLFLEKYVREPIQQVLASTPKRLPSITFKMSAEAFSVRVQDDISIFARSVKSPTDRDIENEEATV